MEVSVGRGAKEAVLCVEGETPSGQPAGRRRYKSGRGRKAYQRIHN
jgi:hypothetical protein